MPNFIPQINNINFDRTNELEFALIFISFALLENGNGLFQSKVWE